MEYGTSRNMAGNRVNKISQLYHGIRLPIVMDSGHFNKAGICFPSLVVIIMKWQVIKPVKLAMYINKPTIYGKWREWNRH
jgi:hypothetical protein